MLRVSTRVSLFVVLVALMAAAFGGAAVRAATPVLLLSVEKATSGDVIAVTYDIGKGGCDWPPDTKVSVVLVDPNSVAASPIAGAQLADCVALVKCGVNPRLGNLPPDHGPGAGNRTDDVQNKINNIAKGFFANSDEELERPFLFGGGTYAEQRSAFLVKVLYENMPRGEPRVVPPALPDSEDARVRELFPMIWRIWNMWDRMEHDHTGAPNNVPLTRSIAGRRDFDINIDGVAHYGMYADFLQDLKNVGFGDGELGVLFRSAEDYIQVWERCEAFASGQTLIQPEQTGLIRETAVGQG